MFNKINGLAYNQKLCIVSDKCKVNSNIKTPVKSIAYAIRYVRQYKLEDIVDFGLGKLLSGRGFAKLSTFWGEGSYKELHINSPLRFSHA